MFDKVTKIFQYGHQTVILETGEIARQADGAVMVTIDDTVVLATVVGSKTAKEGQDFFPLTVDYVEKFYAAGRIPGGFSKREGKPSDKEVLVSRLIDRPLRPLFPDNFYNEVQIIIHVLSCNPEVDPDVPAMIAASAALSLSGIPFNGPIGAARVGYINNEYVLNPTMTDLKNSQMDLVVAATEHAVLMVESEAQQLSEEVMLGGIVFGHEQMQVAINAIHDLVRDAGKPLWNFTPPSKNEALYAEIEAIALEPLTQAYQTTNKQERTAQTRAVSDRVIKTLSEANNPATSTDINNILFALESKIVRGNILNGLPRIDGRDTRTVRPIAMRTGVLPRAHGSALFTRGETQALVVATLGTKQETQAIDSIMSEGRDRFMFHYNMPPFATGETGRFGTPKRREIGHGRLAKRALTPLLPTMEEFQYAIRLVSEITESNGSSSMASVCGGCLALMDAGVPIKAHVAGVAMGLIKEGNKFAVLTDILGDEDHLGDMDFKVAGTAQGITALQMDIKIQGITKDIMKIALAQAQEGRLHILSTMQINVAGASSEVSNFAPRMLTLKIHPDKIRDLIGKGGATIRGLCEETGCKIDISDEGLVTVSTMEAARGEAAIEKIRALTAIIEMGQVYDGKVMRLLDFGAIVEVLPGKDGMLHISQVAHERIEQLSDYLTVGQIVKVKVVEADDRGRIRFSMKALLERPEQATTSAAPTSVNAYEA